MALCTRDPIPGPLFTGGGAPGVGVAFGACGEVELGLTGGGGFWLAQPVVVAKKHATRKEIDRLRNP